MSEADKDFTVNPQKIKGNGLVERFARGIQNAFGIAPKPEAKPTITSSAQASKPTAGK